eukprot:7035205-Alexandrium_andersonii.AAC.1
MSASLVGSEMCIRDRCLSRKKCSRGESCSDVYASEGGDVVIRDEVREGAVSYTHLTLPTICSV